MTNPLRRGSVPGGLSKSQPRPHFFLNAHARDS